MHSKDHEDSGLEGLLASIASRTGCDDWQPFKSSLKRRCGFIHFVESRHYEVPRLVIKAYHWKKSRVDKYYTRAKKLHKAGNSRFDIAAPIFQIDECNAIAMEYVCAPTLRESLLRSLARPFMRRELIAQTGAWLAWFHHSGQVQAKPFKKEKHDSAFRFEAKHAEVNGVGRDKALSDCLGVVARFTSQMDGQIMPHAPLHGDLHPSNLFSAGKRTIGIDFGPGKNLPVYHDASRFLIYLGDYRVLPVKARDLGKYGCDANDMEVFWKAYSPEEPLDLDLWRRIHFIEITRLLAARTSVRKTQSGNFRKQIFRTLQYRRYRRCARHLIKALG